MSDQKLPTIETVAKSPKSYGLLIMWWALTGFFGGHRIYAGRGSWLYSLTMAWFLMGWLVDLVTILQGRFEDGHGRAIRP